MSRLSLGPAKCLSPLIILKPRNLAVARIMQSTAPIRESFVFCRDLIEPAATAIGVSTGIVSA